MIVKFLEIQLKLIGTTIKNINIVCRSGQEEKFLLGLFYDRIIGWKFMEYTFKNKKTGKVETYQMRLAEYDAFKENHPNLERWFESAPRMNYRSIGSDFKPDNTWKEVMSKIGEQNPNSKIADEYTRKSSKQIKTKQIVEKHLKKAAEAAKPKR